MTPAFIMCMVGILLVGLAFESPWWRLLWALFMLYASASNLTFTAPLERLLAPTVYLTAQQGELSAHHPS